MCWVAHNVSEWWWLLMTGNYYGCKTFSCHWIVKYLLNLCYLRHFSCLHTSLVWGSSTFQPAKSWKRHYIYLWKLECVTLLWLVLKHDKYTSGMTINSAHEKDNTWYCVHENETSFLKTFCKENFNDEICDWKNSVFSRCKTMQIHCEIF